MEYIIYSHETHNPHADIVMVKLDENSFLTYGKILNNGQEFSEYYSGKNHGGVSEKSYSRYYQDITKVPNKYYSNLMNLVEKFNEVFAKQ